MLGVTLIITLVPFRFAIPEAWDFGFMGPITDIVANVILFLPLGFFYCFARSGASAFNTLIAGALLSGGIELTQLFEPERHAHASDIFANALGAYIGALVARRVARSPKFDGRLVGWLALHLPLVGLIYLLVPLLWINALASGHELVRAGMALVLGLFGAVLLGGVHRYYLAFARAVSARTTAALAALWFTAGAIPFFASRPLELLVGPAIVAAVTWLYGRTQLRPGGANRRFETLLLTRAVPLFAFYLVAIICAPLRRGLNAWHWTLALPEIVHQLDILRFLELAAAFTLVGYIAAEFKGRVYGAYADAAPWVLAWGGALALIAELVRGYDASSGASVVHGLLLVAAALYGGWLYYLQRAHVMRLLSS